MGTERKRKQSAPAIRATRRDPIVRRIEAAIRALPPTANGAECGRWEGLTAARHYRIRELALGLGLPYLARFDGTAWSIP